MIWNRNLRDSSGQAKPIKFKLRTIVRLVNLAWTPYILTKWSLVLLSNKGHKASFQALCRGKVIWTDNHMYQILILFLNATLALSGSWGNSEAIELMLPYAQRPLLNIQPHSYCPYGKILQIILCMYSTCSQEAFLCHKCMITFEVERGSNAVQKSTV